MHLAAVVLLVQVAIPAPTGHVNDFAGVLDSASIRHMEAVNTDIRAKTRGEIAVVTLSTIGDRSASEVALQIGRQWGVGAAGEAGDPAKNAGVVVLLVPLADRKPGSGQIFVATGRGAEGFLPDSRVGRIRDAVIPFLAREDYGRGLAVGVDLLAQAFASEFSVVLDSSAQPLPQSREPEQPRIPRLWIILAIILLIMFSRGRIFLLPWLMSGMGGGRGRRGGWGGGGFGGGWGGGGGFGGFGGGGGFSGGGAGGRF
jgi:uncharacterized protein